MPSILRPSRRIGWVQKPPVGTPIDYGSAIGQGLVGCWNFNENGGLTVFDATGIYGNGVLTNISGSGAPGWKTGLHGSELNIGGVPFGSSNNRCVSIPHNAKYALGDAWSLDIWFLLNTGSGVVTCKSGSSPGTEGPWSIGLTSSTNLLVETGGSSQNITVAAGLSYRLTLSVGSNDNGSTSNLLLNLNGIYSESTVSGTNNDIGNAIILGALVNGAGNLDGQIAFFRLWNRALSVSELQQLYIDPYCFMVRPRLLGIRNPYVIPATPINQTAADTLTFTDAVTTQIIANAAVSISVSDTITITDSLQTAGFAFINQTISDTITFTDATTGTFAGLTVQVSDTLTFVDNWNYLDVSASDSFAITDQLMGMSIILLLNVSDTFAFTDGFQILDQDATGVDIYVPPLVDSLTFSDEVVSTVGIQVSDSDTLTLSDNVALTEAGSLVFSTTLTFLDSISISAPSPSQSLSDFISLSDRVILQLVGFLAPTVGDAITFTDAVMIGLDLHQLTIADTLVFLDSTNQMMGYAPSFSDTITLTDSFNLNHGQNTAPSDIVGFTDSLQLDIVGIINLSFADSLILVDSAQDTTNPPPTINLQFGDSVSFTDSEEELDQQVVYLIDLSDSLNLSDAIRLQNQDALSLFQDSIVFSDSIQIDLAGNLNTYLRRYLNDVLPN